MIIDLPTQEALTLQYVLVELRRRIANGATPSEGKVQTLAHINAVLSKLEEGFANTPPQPRKP